MEIFPTSHRRRIKRRTFQCWARGFSAHSTSYPWWRSTEGTAPARSHRRNPGKTHDGRQGQRQQAPPSGQSPCRRRIRPSFRKCRAWTRARRIAAPVAEGARSKSFARRVAYATRTRGGKEPDGKTEGSRRVRIARESPRGTGPPRGRFKLQRERAFKGRTWEMDHGAFSGETDTARRLPFCASVKSSRASCEPSRRRPRVHACVPP